MAKDIFKEVRRAYSNGLKSSNKTYARETNTLSSMLGIGKRNQDDAERLEQAGFALDTLRRQSQHNANTGIAPAPQKKLVIDVGNCGELARASAKMAAEKGMHAEVWQLDDDDHAFAVIGKPPAGKTVDFADWKNVWIVDPWLGVESEATSYIKKANEKMRKWQSDGKRVLSREGPSEPLDREWLAALNEGSKSAHEVPSPENPNPWKTFTTAVDYRRIVKSQDVLHSPIKIGDTQVQRTELFDMGAVLDGKPIGLEGIKYRSIDALADHLSFDAVVLRQKIREHGESGDHAAVARMADILADVSTYKEGALSGQMLVGPGGVVDKTSSALNKNLDRLRHLAGEARRAADSGNPTTIILPGKTAATFNNVGVGMQAFGVYNGIRGMVEAIAQGETAEAVLSGAGVAAEGVSLGAEKGFAALGKAIEKDGVGRLADFAKSSLGKTLGGPAKLGANVSRVGGAAGLAVSLPFDIYNAVSSFTAAGQSAGKIAQDHYVDGGLAVAGAATSIGATAAGFAGLAAAGPIGLVAGALLLASSRIYHSARYVEELGEHTTVSDGERFAAGLSAFFGGGAPQAVEDRVSVSKASTGYLADQREAAVALLQKNPQFGHLVFGDAVIKAQRPIIHPNPYVGPIIIQQPAIVKGNQADDRIDASTAVESVRTAVKAPAGEGKDVLWVTGTGDDELIGSNDRANHFLIDDGKKRVVGGQKDDVFELNAVPSKGSVLDGGDGIDSLRLNGGSGAGERHIVAFLPGVPGSAADGPSEREVSGTINVDGEHVVQLKSIENVSTSEGGRTAVIGNDADNRIVLNGRDDTAVGRSGNDTYVLNGTGSVSIIAGDGVNRYAIGHRVDNVTIQSYSEDGSHALRVDFDSSDLTVRALKDRGDLEIVAESPEGRKRIILSNVFRRDAAGNLAPARKEGSISLTTRDEMILTPLLSSINQAPDGRLHLGAMLARRRPGAG